MQAGGKPISKGNTPITSGSATAPSGGGGGSGGGSKPTSTSTPSSSSGGAQSQNQSQTQNQSQSQTQNQINRDNTGNSYSFVVLQKPNGQQYTIYQTGGPNSVLGGNKYIVVDEATGKTTFVVSKNDLISQAKGGGAGDVSQTIEKNIQTFEGVRSGQLVSKDQLVGNNPNVKLFSNDPITGAPKFEVNSSLIDVSHLQSGRISPYVVDASGRPIARAVNESGSYQPVYEYAYYKENPLKQNTGSGGPLYERGKGYIEPKTKEGYVLGLVDPVTGEYAGPAPPNIQKAGAYTFKQNNQVQVGGSDKQSLEDYAFKEFKLNKNEYAKINEVSTTGGAVITYRNLTTNEPIKITYGQDKITLTSISEKPKELSNPNVEMVGGFSTATGAVSIYKNKATGETYQLKENDNGWELQTFTPAVVGYSQAQPLEQNKNLTKEQMIQQTIAQAKKESLEATLSNPFDIVSLPFKAVERGISKSNIPVASDVLKAVFHIPVEITSEVGAVARYHSELAKKGIPATDYASELLIGSAVTAGLKSYAFTAGSLSIATAGINAVPEIATQTAKGLTFMTAVSVPMQAVSYFTTPENQRQGTLAQNIEKTISGIWNIETASQVAIYGAGTGKLLATNPVYLASGPVGKGALGGATFSFIASDYYQTAQQKILNVLAGGVIGGLGATAEVQLEKRGLNVGLFDVQYKRVGPVETGETKPVGITPIAIRRFSGGSAEVYGLSIGENTGIYAGERFFGLQFGKQEAGKPVFISTPEQVVTAKNRVSDRLSFSEYYEKPTIRGYQRSQTLKVNEKMLVESTRTGYQKLDKTLNNPNVLYLGSQIERATELQGINPRYAKKGSPDLDINTFGFETHRRVLQALPEGTKIKQGEITPQEKAYGLEYKAEIVLPNKKKIDYKYFEPTPFAPLLTTPVQVMPSTQKTIKIKEGGYFASPQMQVANKLSMLGYAEGTGRVAYGSQKTKYLFDIASFSSKSRREAEQKVREMAKNIGLEIKIPTQQKSISRPSKTGSLFSSVSQSSKPSSLITSISQSKSSISKSPSQSISRSTSSSSSRSSSSSSSSIPKPSSPPSKPSIFSPPSSPSSSPPSSPTSKSPPARPNIWWDIPPALPVIPNLSHMFDLGGSTTRGTEEIEGRTYDIFRALVPTQMLRRIRKR